MRSEQKSVLTNVRTALTHSTLTKTNYFRTTLGRCWQQHVRVTNKAFTNRFAKILKTMSWKVAASHWKLFRIAVGGTEGRVWCKCGTTALARTETQQNQPVPSASAAQPEALKINCFLHFIKWSCPLSLCSLKVQRCGFGGPPLDRLLNLCRTFIKNSELTDAAVLITHIVTNGWWYKMKMINCFPS